MPDRVWAFRAYFFKRLRLVRLDLFCKFNFESFCAASLNMCFIMQRYCFWTSFIIFRGGFCWPLIQFNTSFWSFSLRNANHLSFCLFRDLLSTKWRQSWVNREDLLRLVLILFAGRALRLTDQPTTKNKNTRLRTLANSTRFVFEGKLMILICRFNEGFIFNVSHIADDFSRHTHNNASRWDFCPRCH